LTVPPLAAEPPFRFDKLMSDCPAMFVPIRFASLPSCLPTLIGRPVELLEDFRFFSRDEGRVGGPRREARNDP
jgi:hypothetical protein